MLCNFSNSIRDAKEDIKNGKTRVLTSKEHFEELDSAIRD